MAAAAPAVAIEGRFPPGEVLAGRYRIVAPLGRGGMGEVYRATDLVLQQTVALKFLSQSLSRDPLALNQLYNEVRLARQVSHPNVCRVHDVAEADGLRFLTMEYVDGEDLRTLLRRIGRLPGEKAGEIARRLCAGLAAAHARGVLHRDLKPANIMLDAQGNVRITDFGLAVLGESIDAHDHGSGTPAYMAPEQLAGERASVRTDIYSLGLVLYEIFGGLNPFKTATMAELLRLKDEASPAAFVLGGDVDPQIGRAVAHCLARNPRDRPASAAEVAAELSGGDPLAAAMAAGETPAPELVARAGSTEGLPVGLAVSYLAASIAALIAVALIAPRINILQRLHLDRADALERVARDKLSTLGLRDSARHRVTRFSYDIDALRHGFEPAALYFWYRASPDWLIPLRPNAVVTADDPPSDMPGMITTRWDATGRLLYLKAAPPPDAASSVESTDLWSRVFAAAGLQPAQFSAAEPGWIGAPGWDERASWIGTYPDGSRTRVRVEAAAWRGRPVYFEVVPGWRSGRPQQGTLPIDRIPSAQWPIFISLFAISAVVAWRNVRLGRGDRQGAFRIAVFILVVSCALWA
jgi:tRNA A-37 threonylcarbamoyl transferase component Bud32